MRARENRKSKKEMVRPERFELPTYWFVASRSIQLSYGRMSKSMTEYQGSCVSAIAEFRLPAPALEPAARKSRAILH